ncbi:hypothetical protein [Mycolicibacterium monacense]|uniref:Uncharacterized protein n=1 Tax=Mycolicibacterium monacense TaxID=85693 RepID=A0AAD1ITC3_MYCMB|nr:hypothetical protein [Mycolicibacterium monacense]MDA4102050.1 hypothetical protein [Mycolicibacterium monacense DSM 44395]ORB20031.1 hypothetical protein BST34_13790 [Mycolicibacterium monacense DSM 44395]QHP86793.1 hypothetical protein EWR22_16345 [Mycolicibacterium monacense DSM 44395]BBZ60134.1 hypothetical protein MMON_14350 [Mycolicibacterium monacense]
MTQDADLGRWFTDLLQAAEDRAQAVHDAYQHLENAEVVSKVTVHRYLCRKCGKPRATVIRLGDRTLARTHDYKFSPGMNADRSVPSARARNTLDGDRHWPGHTYDVDELAEWGPDAGFDVNCRHVTATVFARDVLAITSGVTPGHPGKPTLLQSRQHMQ